MNRRKFIKTSLAVGATAAVPGALTELTQSASAASGGTSGLPWLREIPLKEAAKSVAFEGALSTLGPGQGQFGGAGMMVTNLKMRTYIWGKPDRITVSLNKNNVWDRRVNVRAFWAPTLEEITEGAFSPANKNYVGHEPASQRPREYGYLRKEGGSYDPWRQPLEYPFPCMKPVGQIILGMDALAGAEAPGVTQSCADGLVKIEPAKGDAKASVEYMLGMTSNIYAIRASLSGITSPVWLRLYRHRDTSHTAYMNAEGTEYTRRNAEPDKAFNFPMDPPTSGKDGQYFWIRQKFPSEKTFPDGFEYVLMGLLIAPGQVTVETVENQTNLGTAPPTRAIAVAPGAAATATFTPSGPGKLEALVCVVTTMDGGDIMQLARMRLDAAVAAGGFNGILNENTQWWNAFYDKREEGRIFHGVTGTKCSDDIRVLYRSYTDSHGGGTKVDMRKHEHAASYALGERDIQPWNSMSCYNEVFTTPRYVRNWADSEDMWKYLVSHWMEAGKQNARDMFGLPGMLVVHGYLAPIKADRYMHTTLTLEYCFGTMAEIIKPVWDEWDYGGDIRVLRDECYPLMREMAIFYAAYAKKGADGYYHVIPCMEEERWGWTPNFARNKDITSSLCMFRWGLNKAADAAELLGVDAELRENWRKVAAEIAPYATWRTADGPAFASMEGLEPVHVSGDHFGDASEYPTVLADEVNLDSPEEVKNMMRRTIKAVASAGTTATTRMLLGVPPAARAGGGDSGMMSLFGPMAENLLNSRGGRMHLFPAVQPDAEVAFRKFQARGGFLVSACREAGGVTYLEIQARRDLPCQVMNPWPGQKAAVRDSGNLVPVALDTSNGECLVFSAVAGHTYLIEKAG